MNLLYLLNAVPVLILCIILAVPILMPTALRLNALLTGEGKLELQVYPNFLQGPNCSIIASNFSLARPKPGPNFLERGLICLLSATISSIILITFWQHTELFNNLIHVSNSDLLNRSLADVILSVVCSLPIIHSLEIYFYQRQRKGRWQSLLFDRNVFTDTFMTSSFLFWSLPILLLALANGMDAEATFSVSRCLLNCSVLSLFAMQPAICIAIASRYTNISGVDALSLKKYCQFLEDDNFSCVTLDAMTAAQLLDLTNVAVITGDLEKADIISSYHLASVAPNLAFD